ncbi:hypothetical protein HW49_11025 [Porphyromonadaceae bacterium COT-184 OH4590]|nr:hypothetical protein HW49_11025 [Porphyromonadaceae bacterium COT-184 OH4590]
MDNNKIQYLISCSKDGDRFAFSSLVRYFQSKIFSLTFRMLCNEDEAKDVMQDVFIKAWLHLNDYDSKYHFSTWLYRIASNLCLDKIKSFEKTHLTTIKEYNIASNQNIETELINKEIAHNIKQLTNRLSAKQKLLFTLRYLEELDIPEIIDITGMSAAKIKSNLYLARKTITNKIKSIEK